MNESTAVTENEITKLMTLLANAFDLKEDIEIQIQKEDQHLFTEDIDLNIGLYDSRKLLREAFRDTVVYDEDFRALDIGRILYSILYVIQKELRSGRPLDTEGLNNFDVFIANIMPDNWYNGLAVTCPEETSLSQKINREMSIAIVQTLYFLKKINLFTRYCNGDNNHIVFEFWERKAGYPGENKK